MTDFAPRYHVIEQALRTRLAGLAPDDPLPSEAELCREFAVSRMTARAAVNRLADEGLVYRRPGRGTFVAPPARRSAGTLIGFGAQMRRAGRVPSSEVLSAGARPATAEEAERLRLEAAAEVVEIDRVRLADGVPVAVERAVFPGALAALLDADLAGGSVHEALVRLGRTPTLGHATLAAHPATDSDRELLGPDGPAVLVERRLIVDQHGEPVELTESRYAGDRYALDVTFDVEAPA